MTSTVELLIEAVIAREGGFVDHPDDRGGATRFGITERTARTAGYDGPMRELPRALAAAVYRERYWTGPGLDRVNALAPSIAAELFDTGVNMGPAVAAGFLQRALNALNRRERDYADVAPTRAIDAPTLAALGAYLRARGPAAEGVLLKAIEALQGARYIELAEMRPANESFVHGWLAHRLG
jgi:lysozyme family protein